MSLPPLVEEFLLHLEKERQLSPNTVSAYRRDLAAYVEACERRYGAGWKLEQVDRAGVRAFLGELERRGLARRSAARALSAVRSLYRYLQVHHGHEAGAARGARVPKLGRRVPGYLDRERTELHEGRAAFRQRAPLAEPWRAARALGFA